jgi:hypothetical protein
MAKTTGPLFSISASGTIANAMVFGKWKGRNTVRRWVVPENPQSTLQGYLRASMKSIGKWVAKVAAIKAGDATNSVIYKACTATCGDDENWNAYIMKGFLDTIIVGGAVNTSNFTALVAEYSALSTAVKSAWASDATLLGIADLSFGYGYTTNIPAGLILYMGAKACVAKGIIGTAPYNTGVASWVASDVDNFKADHTATV